MKQIFSANDGIKENSYKLLNRWYYTPSRLAKRYSRHGVGSRLLQRPSCPPTFTRAAAKRNHQPNLGPAFTGLPGNLLAPLIRGCFASFQPCPTPGTGRVVGLRERSKGAAGSRAAWRWRVKVAGVPFSGRLRNCGQAGEPLDEVPSPHRAPASPSECRMKRGTEEGGSHCCPPPAC